MAGSKKKRRSRAVGKCRSGTIHFRTRRGKTVTFTGHHGKGCGPRPKPKTGHLKVWKEAMARAARHCKRQHLHAHAFRNCIATQIPR